MTYRIALDLDLAVLDETALASAETIVTKLRHQSPLMFDALGWMLEHERERRRCGDPGLVLFNMGETPLAEAEQAARVALQHAGLATEAARAQTAEGAGDSLLAVACVFLAIHNGIVAAVGDDLQAYRISQRSPQNPAVN